VFGSPSAGADAGAEREMGEVRASAALRRLALGTADVAPTLGAGPGAAPALLPQSTLQLRLGSNKYEDDDDGDDGGLEGGRAGGVRVSDREAPEDADDMLGAAAPAVVRAASSPASGFAHLSQGGRSSSSGLAASASTGEVFVVTDDTFYVAAATAAAQVGEGAPGAAADDTDEDEVGSGSNGGDLSMTDASASSVRIDPHAAAAVEGSSSGGADGSTTPEGAPDWARFARWATCFCIVTFDLELGQGAARRTLPLQQASPGGHTGGGGWLQWSCVY
jgi:hypothetical protein